MESIFGSIDDMGGQVMCFPMFVTTATPSLARQKYTEVIIRGRVFLECQFLDRYMDFAIKRDDRTTPRAAL